MSSRNPTRLLLPAAEAEAEAHRAAQIGAAAIVVEGIPAPGQKAPPPPR